MKSHHHVVLYCLVASLLGAPIVSAEPTTKPVAKPNANPSAPRPKSEATLLAEHLANPDKAEQDKALDRIKQLLADKDDADDGKPGAKVNVDPNWIKSLLKVKRYDDAEQLALTGALGRANDGATVAMLQKMRAQALLAEQKYDAALSAAKGYYNVCPMKSSSDAIDLVAVCLVNARPDDHGLARKFKAQQVAAASTQPSVAPSTTQPSGAMASDNVLSTITVDPKPYDDAIANLAFKDYDNLLAKGNLLLLADKPKEARQAFETALDLAEGAKQMSSATEAVARSIRAQSGGIGPANAYILAQRGN